MKKLFPFLTLFISFTALIAQERNLEKAEKAFEEFSYLKAQKIFEKVYENGYVTPLLLEQLGDSYYFVADYKKAFNYYKELVENSSDVSEIYKLRYAVAKKSLENSYLKSTKEALKYQITNLSFNSTKSDYAPAFYKDSIIFSSARDSVAVLRRTQKWTGEVFTDLFITNQQGSTVKELSKKINSKFNEGTVVFDSISQKLYFTRNNYLKRKRGRSKEKSTLLKIYSADLIDNKWTNIKELPINSDEFNSAHPALSEDGKYLYFSSDRPGGYGNSDIYKVEILEDNLLGTPQNLGPEINSIARETFPSIHKDMLFFASDREESFGGLDIFSFDLKNKALEKLVAPINSNQDDFSLIINTENQIGYFTSNRDGGKGGDDIYSFNWESISKVNAQVIVYDAETLEVVPNASIEWKEESDLNFIFEESNINGLLYLNKIEKSTYIINAFKEGYIKNGVVASFDENNKKAEVFLSKEQTKLKIGDDLKYALQINRIYFDLDKFNIRPDAAVDLMKIKLLLDEYPNMEIQINSHTDSRQTEQYNERLSHKRAVSTYNWLVEQGINQKRLKFKGYGESKLLNKCNNDSICTEEEHQKNRRNEFIITKI